MDKQTILHIVSQLEQAAQKMDEPDKTLKLADVSQIRIAIESMSIADIAQKMQGIELPDMQEIDASLEQATQIIIDHTQRVNAFNTAYGIIKAVINVAL